MSRFGSDGVEREFFSSSSSRLVLLLISVILFIFFLVGAFQVFTDLKSSLECNSWPFVHGKMLKSDVTTKLTGGGLKTKMLDLEYEYEIGGKMYRGSRLSYSSQMMNEVENFSKNYPKDSKVKVYYKPNSPANSILTKARISISQVVFQIVFYIIVLILGLVAFRFFKGIGEHK